MRQTYNNMRNKIDGHAGESILTPQERAAVVKEIGNDSRVLEIGTYQGATVGEWAKQRPEAFFISVDNFSWTGDYSRQDNVSAWISNQQKNMRLFVGTAKDLVRIAQACSFDFIFVDGDHTYAGCKSDLEAADRLRCERGCVICGHDYATDNPGQCGVTRAVDEFCKDRGFSIHHTTGSVFFIQC